MELEAARVGTSVRVQLDSIRKRAGVEFSLGSFHAV